MKPLHSPQTLPKNAYPNNWKDLSLQIRQNAKHTCSDCGKDCNDQKKDLHVHHIDGMKWNNKINNLKVLCSECHSNQPGHKHMKRATSHKRVVRKY